MAGKTRKRDTRTAVEAVVEWCEEVGSQRAAAEALDVTPQRLNNWINRPEAQLGDEARRAISRAVGIPFEAVAFKLERICDVEKRAA